MSPRHGGAAARVPDASMTLLSEVYRRPLDPGYQEAARRRAAGAPPRSPGRPVVVLVLTVLVGLAVTAATLALRAPSTSAVAAHRLLVQQIAAEQARAVDERARRATASADLARVQAAALADESPTLLARLSQDAAGSGVLAVQGPGVQVELTDAPSTAGASASADDRVQDVDLQVVVNGLWAVGAEAIAINGARLTTTTAIRTAGSAVLVDLQPLRSPYTVAAIGDPSTLASGLAASSAGAHLATLHAGYGIGVQISTTDRLLLPGTGPVTLAVASPLPSASAAPAPTAAGASRVTPSSQRGAQEGRTP